MAKYPPLKKKNRKCLLRIFIIIDLGTGKGSIKGILEKTIEAGRGREN